MNRKIIKYLRTSVLCLFALSQSLPARADSTLRVCDDVDQPATLDPFRVFSEKTHTIIQQVIEPLVRFDPEGKLEPCLAESWERTSPTAVRFHLRKGVFFHDGTPFDAKAVKFSLEKFVAPETKYPGFGFVGTIARVDIIDEFTVDVVTHVPDGLLLNRLAAFCHVVSPKAYRELGAEAFGEAPVGTGPFKFQAWAKGKEINLEKNDGYWMAGFPKVSKISFIFLPIETQLKELYAGKTDIVTEMPGTRTLITMESGTATVVKKETYFTIVGVMNINLGPLKDKRVRQAINLAINREDFIRYDVLANGTLIATSTMPGEEGHDPTLKPYPYDLPRAKELMKAAGYEKGIVINAIVKDAAMRTMGIVKRQLQDINVTLNITETTDANIVQDIASREWGILFGTCPDPMVHSFFIQSIILYSKSPYSITKNPVLDEKLEAMVATLDGKERARKAREIDRYVYNEYLDIPTYQRLRTYGVRKGVVFKPPVTGMPHYYSAEKK